MRLTVKVKFIVKLLDNAIDKPDITMDSLYIYPESGMFITQELSSNIYDRLYLTIAKAKGLLTGLVLTGIRHKSNRLKKE